MLVACRVYVGGQFMEALKTRCQELFDNSANWSLEVSKEDPHIIRFRYPVSSARSLAYVVPQVVLELGTHAEFVPRDQFTIKSFVAEEFPAIADIDIPVVALLAKRTFWEKTTILHAEYHRPTEKSVPERYSRHYYDVAMLAAGPIRSEALADTEFLAQVVRHKETFYASAWARYDLARPGSLRLLPSEKRTVALERDYRRMHVMIFEEPPEFGDIIESLASLETRINERHEG